MRILWQVRIFPNKQYDIIKIDPYLDVIAKKQWGPDFMEHSVYNILVHY